MRALPAIVLILSSAGGPLGCAGVRAAAGAAPTRVPAEPAPWPQADAWVAACPLAGHVAPGGDDRSDGSAGHPWATLAGARDGVRRLRAQGLAQGPVVVQVADGDYALAEPLVLDARDGGLAFVAAPGAAPVIHADVPVGGWKVAADGAWEAQVDLAGRPAFEALWMDGRRAPRARWPDAGSAVLGEVTETLVEAPEEYTVPGKLGVVKKQRGGSARQVAVLPGEAFRLLAGLDPAHLRAVELVMYHKWDVTRRRVVGLDAARHAVVLEGSPMKPWNAWDKGTPFHLENAPAACDAPGEWFLEAGGRLRYRPLPGEDPARVKASVPRAAAFVEAHGTVEQPVERVAFRGLRFVGAQPPLSVAECDPVQAAAQTRAAVMADHARNLVFEDCGFAHTGGWGLWFREGCRDGLVRHCDLHDLGAGGVRIGSADISAPLSTRITVDDCLIAHGGRVNASAAGILVCHGADCAVTHNDIADFYYTGISVGWVWGYADSPSKRNLVAFNRVRRIGQGVLSDMAGLYTLGASEGTVVRGNVFMDIQSRTYGGWGLYTDEGSTGILMEDNLVVGTKTGGFHQHYGKDNVVRNNIFVGGAEQQVQATRVEGHRSFAFEDNIVAWDNPSPALRGPWGKLRFDSGRNCWWAGGRPVAFAGQMLADWQAAGHETGSVVADPLFVDAAHGDYRLRPESPAITLGFRPFDPSQAGVRKEDAPWRASADKAGER